MKNLLFICLLILVSCSSIKNSGNGQDIVSDLGYYQEKGEFNFNNLFLLLKLDHNRKEITSCQGIFPFNEEKGELLKIYDKSQKIVNSGKLAQLQDGKLEYIIIGLTNNDELKQGIKNCRKIKQKFLKAGYTIP